MFKYFISIVFIFLVCSGGTIYAQVPADSPISQENPVSDRNDSSSSGADSSEGTSDNNVTYQSDDSLYLPVKDSSFLNTYTLREVTQGRVNKYLADPDYAYANDPAYWIKDKPGKNPGGNSFWNFLNNKTFQWALFLAVIAVIVYGIYLLARENNFKWFSRRDDGSQQAESIASGEDPVDYDEAIRKYQAEGNYRFAIRYLFLRLIHSAAEKNIIRIRDSMTNSEIGSAFAQPELAAQFRYLATAYEYIYFGDFDLKKDVFDSLKMKFEIFQNKITA